VYLGLLICFIVLGIVFIGGTIYGLFSHAIAVHQAQSYTTQKTTQASETGQTFTGIGRLRVSTADPKPGMVILFVSFKYNPDDKPFSEELALRVKDFRGIIVNYIGSLSAADLQKSGEEKIKGELLRRFNDILRLGHIEILYFSDFMIVE